MMKLRVFLNLIRSKFNLEQERVRSGAYQFTDDKIRYLIIEEWKKTEKELSEIIANMEKAIIERTEKGLEGLMLNKESLEPARPFLEFLHKRWQRIRLDSPASFLIDPNSPANICYSEIGRWLKDSIHCTSSMVFLVPTLRQDVSSFPENGSKDVLSDDETVFIHVPDCLLAPDKKGQLHYTHPALEEKVLTENEKNRVINFCPETRAYYQSIELGQRQKRFEYGRMLREKKSLRPPLVSKQEGGEVSYGYSEEGRKLLISHLFKNQEDLIVALQGYSPAEHEAFLANFDFNDLCIILGIEAGDHFKQNLHYFLYSQKGYEEKDKQAIFLFILKYFYQLWLNQQSAKEKVFEEWDVIVMNRLREDEADRKILAGESQEDGSFRIFSPLMNDFYSNIQEDNCSELKASKKVQEEINKIHNLVQALQSISFIDMVWQEFANKFSCNQLNVIMLGLTKPSPSEFTSAFSKALADDSLFTADPNYNRRLIYWFNYLYESWRASQGKCTTFFWGFEMGYEKQVKIEASRFIGHFLAMNAGIEEFDHCLDTYIRDLEKENQTRVGETKLSDPQQVRGALQNGMIRYIIARMKEVLSPDFVPKSSLQKTA